MHVFITGGTRGIGRALVREFCQKGHRVSFTGTTQEGIMKAVVDVDGEVKGYVLDVRDKAQIEAVAKKAIDAFGPIDIWINNAGVPQEGHKYIVDLPQDNTDRVIDVNVKGMIYGTQVALSFMTKQNHGIVYNMEGLGSNGMIIRGEVLYGGSKRFLTYFSKGVNKELKNSNVQVGTLQPGMVFTSFLLDNMSEEGMPIARILGSHPEQVARFLVKKMLNGKRKIAYLTNWRMIGRFVKYPFVRQNKDVHPT